MSSLVPKDVFIYLITVWSISNKKWNYSSLCTLLEKPKKSETS